MENKLLLKLSKRYVKYLESKPENGMGYHIVDIQLKNGRILKDRIALNSELLKLTKEEEFWNKDIKKLMVKP